MAIESNTSAQDSQYVWLVRGNGSMLRITEDAAKRLMAGSANYRLATDDEIARKKQYEVNATSEARKLAIESGVNLVEVQGSGADGNIVLDDVKKAAKESKES